MEDFFAKRMKVFYFLMCSQVSSAFAQDIVYLEVGDGISLLSSALHL